LDRDRAKKNLETILEKIHADSDISELHEYRKIYKKEVSLFRRSWAAAWLLMYYDKREMPDMHPVRASAGNKNVSDSGERKKSGFQQEISLSEEESKRLFISIGKNRRLFPREVITLIMSKTSSAREDIGLIRILDNYSFVQVRDVKADEIINALNGMKFRGRTLAVNFAKPKTGENESE